MTAANQRYVLVWEFEIIPDKKTEFLDAYGPSGAWAALFGRANGYLGTLLFNDRTSPTKYLTVDRWRSCEAHESFLAAFRTDYEALDKACEAFTLRETSLGTYWEVVEHPSR